MLGALNKGCNRSARASRELYAIHLRGRPGLVARPCAAGAGRGRPGRSGPVTIVVPFQAGGSADLLARILQQHLQADLGSPFVVETRSGAGGCVGTAYVARAPNDGYTLLLGTLSGNVLNEFIYDKLPYDPAGATSSRFRCSCTCRTSWPLRQRCR